ncbi:hypothetical protein [uncultured Thiodictyon sp.]|uniref:hypothetical protein n=1 Tax=uncultured Thiodictyon sp. TaxID=1846217 RepID=UPI0025F93D8F|nr:hypothetical protein [uncultured Thiodictyon sp.]
MHPAFAVRRLSYAICAITGLAGGGCGLLPGESGAGRAARVTRASLPWSNIPPGAQRIADVPQFVSITSDDNFGDEALYRPVGGMASYLELMADWKNPVDRNGRMPFDATPLRGTFFLTARYMDARWKRSNDLPI